MKLCFLAAFSLFSIHTLRAMDAVKVSSAKRSFRTYLWARQVVPHLHCLTPEEMTSFSDAYGYYFRDMPHLFSMQDTEGNTLLHRILMKHRNIPLFLHVCFAGAALTIKNIRGITVEKMLNDSSYYAFKIARKQEMLARRARQLMSEYRESRM